MSDPRDAAARQTAAEHVRRIAVGDTLTSEQLAAGFEFGGERLPLVNPQRGIFKPKSLRYLLSVRTVYPRSGARVWYDDQRIVQEQVARGDELIDYAFMGKDPEAADNRWLREAHNDQVPFLYFLGVAPGRYTAIWPTYVVDWLPGELKVRLAFGERAVEIIPDAPERRYASRMVHSAFTRRPSAKPCCRPTADAVH